jgi:hypothetical protein
MKSKLPTIEPKKYRIYKTCLICYDYREACVVGYVKHENLKGLYAKRVRRALTRDFYNEVKGSELTVVRYR